MSQPLLYDPRYHTFESWASLLCEQYAANQLEIPNQYTDWKMWGNGLKAIDIFVRTRQSLIPTTIRTGMTGQKLC
jgi:hypothetical protein